MVLRLRIRLQYTCITCWDGCFFCSIFSCLRPLHLLPATSAPSPAGCLSLSRARVRLEAAELHTLSISSEKLHSLPQALAWVMAFFFFFGPNYTAAPARHQGLKVLSEAWSLPAEGLTPWGGECGGGSYAMGGRESRAETDSNSLSCNGMISSSPVCLCVHCFQHAGSELCPSACLKNSCRSHLSPDESLISTHSEISLTLDEEGFQRTAINI